jgi:hypothetical protein
MRSKSSRPAPVEDDAKIDTSVANVRCLCSQGFIAYMVAPLCTYYLYKHACGCSQFILPTLISDHAYVREVIRWCRAMSSSIHPDHELISWPPSALKICRPRHEYRFETGNPGVHTSLCVCKYPLIRQRSNAYLR